MPGKVSASRVTNGRSLFIDKVDGRNAAARRFRDIYGELLSGLGGQDGTNEAQRQLVRRAAALSVQAEQLDARLANGEPVDTNAYVTLANALIRVFDKLGADEIQPDQGPSLEDYLARRAQETEEAEDSSLEAHPADYQQTTAVIRRPLLKGIRTRISDAQIGSS